MPLFVANTIVFWLAVFFFSCTLAKLRPTLGLLPIFAALSPYAICMTHVINYDVSANNFMLLSFSLLSFFYCVKKSKCIRSFALISVLLIGFSRTNALSAVLPLSLFIAFVIASKHTGKKIVAIGLAIFLSVFFIQACLNYLLIGGTPSYLQNFTAKYDLVSMSAHRQHTGITANFSEQDKRLITDAYQQTGWYLDISAINHSLAGMDFVPLWLREIYHHPIDYLKVRINTVSRLYTGQTHVMKISRLFYWPNFVAGVNNITDGARKGKGWPPDPYLKPNKSLFAKLYGQWLLAFFNRFPGTQLIPLIGVILLVASGVMRCKGHVSKFLTIAMAMNVTSLAWSLPVIAIIQIPMVRYVFPSNSLVIFSLPFFIAGLLEIKDVARKGRINRPGHDAAA